MAVVTKTLRSSGGDYSLMSTWESTEQTNLVTDGNSHVLECYNDWGSGLTDEVNLLDWTTDATHTITIKAASGEGHGGDPTIGAGFTLTRSANFSAPLRISTPYTTVQDIIFQHTGSSGSALYQVNATDASIVLERCICHGCTNNSTASVALRIASTADNQVQVRNCLVVAGYYGIGDAINTFRTGTLYNNTVLGCTYGIYYVSITASRLYMKNNAVYNSVTADYTNVSSMTTSPSNNASTDSSAPGTSAVTGLASTDFNNYAGGDYSPSVSGALYDAGADLSGTFTDDITGYTRVTWDIGAYEYQSAASASAPPPHKSRRYMQLMQH